jgi:hypothetical protein
MNYNNLKNELANPIYTELTDREARDVLNADDPTLLVERFISYRSILNECDGAGIILDKLSAVASPDVQWAMVGIKTDGIDIGNFKTRVMIDQLVLGDFLTQVEADALKAMAKTQSKAQSLGLGLVQDGHIQHARTI